MDRTVYLDYAATTPTDQRVVDAMLPFFTERYGNANSLYALGRDAARALEDARERVAASIGAARPDEVIFTSGGTESDNTALIGLATAGGRTKGHIVVSAFEHHAVLEAYRMFAHSRSWLRRMEDDIRLGLSAEAAVEKEQSQARARLEMASDPYLRDRLHDLDDLSNRLLRILTGQGSDTGAEMPPDPDRKSVV